MHLCPSPPFPLSLSLSLFLLSFSSRRSSSFFSHHLHHAMNAQMVRQHVQPQYARRDTIERLIQNHAFFFFFFFKKNTHWLSLIFLSFSVFLSFLFQQRLIEICDFFRFFSSLHDYLCIEAGFRVFVVARAAIFNTTHKTQPHMHTQPQKKVAVLHKFTSSTQTQSAMCLRKCPVGTLNRNFMNRNHRDTS